MPEIDRIYDWAESIREKYGDENPIRDEEILAGIILMVKSDFADFKKKSDQDWNTSKEFWEEFNEFEEEYESTN